MPSHYDDMVEGSGGPARAPEFATGFRMEKRSPDPDDLPTYFSDQDESDGGERVDTFRSDLEYGLEKWRRAYEGYAYDPRDADRTENVAAAEETLRRIAGAGAGHRDDVQDRVDDALAELSATLDNSDRGGADLPDRELERIAADYIASERPYDESERNRLQSDLADYIATQTGDRTGNDNLDPIGADDLGAPPLRRYDGDAGNRNLNPLGDDDLGEAPARRPAAGVDDTGSANLDPIGNDDLGAPPLRQDNGEDDAGSQNLNGEDDAGSQNLNPLREDNGEDDDLGAAPPRPDDRNEDDAGRNNLDPIGGDDLGAPLLRRYDGDDAGVGSSNLTPVSENALGEASARPAMDADPEDGDLGRPPSQYQRERERWERAMRERMMTGENGGEADPEDGDLGRPPSQYQRERERWERAMRERMMTGENGGEADPEDGDLGRPPSQYQRERHAGTHDDGRKRRRSQPAG